MQIRSCRPYFVSIYSLHSSCNIRSVTMCRNLVIVFSVILSVVVCRPVPDILRHPSVCFNQILTNACVKACRLYGTKAFCTIISVNTCACQFLGNGDNHTKIDNDKVVVIIKLNETELVNNESEEQLVPYTPPPPYIPPPSYTSVVNSVASVPKSQNNKNSFEEIVSKYDNDVHEQEGTHEETALAVVNPKPDNDHKPDVFGHGGHKVVWREPGILNGTYLDDSEQETTNSVPDIKHFDNTNTIEETAEYQNDVPAIIEHAEFSDPSEATEKKAISSEVSEEKSDSLSTILYKKYLDKERDLRQIITSQTFVVSVVMVYFCVIVLYLCIRTHKRRSNGRIPLISCNEIQKI